MGTQLNKLTVMVVGLAAVTLTGLLSSRATAQSHPQEVLDLIAAHDALAMKIRPLRDRVLAMPSKESSTGFNPDGVPVRAKTGAATGESKADAETRVSETLRHKDRAVTTSDEYGRIKVQFSTLEKKARAERERVNRPNFGIHSARSESTSGDIRFGDGRHGSQLPSGTKSQDKPEAGTAENIDSKEIADARRALAALQHELAALERDVNALGR